MYINEKKLYIRWNWCWYRCHHYRRRRSHNRSTTSTIHTNTWLRLCTWGGRSWNYYFYSVTRIQARSTAMNVSPCLSVTRISQHPQVQTSRHVQYTSRVAVARSASDDNAICYVLPVLWMTSCFSRDWWGARPQHNTGTADWCGNWMLSVFTRDRRTVWLSARTTAADYPSWASWTKSAVYNCLVITNELYEMCELITVMFKIWTGNYCEFAISNKI